MQVKDFMQRDVITVSSQDSIYDALKIFKDKNDKITEYAKGVAGGDWLQEVVENNYTVCKILYERKNFPIDTIKLSFRLAEKLESQCAAFDFVYDSTGNPMVVEVSYGFVAPGYDPCVGYWDKSLHFYEGTFDPQGWMVEMLLNTLQRDRLK